MIEYWKVTEDGTDLVELPSEEDGTLLLTTLTAQFPGACGLKYKSGDSGAFRGIRLAEGKLHPPDDNVSKKTFHCVFPKDNKRKFDDLEEGAKSKRLDTKFKCSDLIVLGLPFKTTEETVREYFEQYGELLLVQVKKFPQTGKSKGFGFIRFANIEAQAKVICSRHMIDGRWCEVKIAGAKSDDLQNALTSKIFVGRLSDTITETDLNEYFSKYGQVLDVYIPKPFRGFAFVNFADPFVTYQICEEDHIIKQVSVHVARAAPRGETIKRDRRDDMGRGYGSSYGGSNYASGSYGGGSYESKSGFGQKYQNGSNYSSYSRPSNYNQDNNGSGGDYGRGGGYRGGGAPREHGSGQNMGAELSAALTPALLAAALNQAGLGNLLSSLQGGGGAAGSSGEAGGRQGGGAQWEGSPGKPAPAAGWSKRPADFKPRERDSFDQKFDNKYNSQYEEGYDKNYY